MADSTKNNVNSQNDSPTTSTVQQHPNEQVEEVIQNSQHVPENPAQFYLAPSHNTQPIGQYTSQFYHPFHRQMQPDFGYTTENRQPMPIQMFQGSQTQSQAHPVYQPYPYNQSIWPSSLQMTHHHGYVADMSMQQAYGVQPQLIPVLQNRPVYSFRRDSRRNFDNVSQNVSNTVENSEIATAPSQDTPNVVSELTGVPEVATDIAMSNLSITSNTDKSKTDKAVASGKQTEVPSRTKGAVFTKKYLLPLKPGGFKFIKKENVFDIKKLSEEFEQTHAQDEVEKGSSTKHTHVAVGVKSARSSTLNTMESSLEQHESSASEKAERLKIADLIDAYYTDRLQFSNNSRSSVDVNETDYDKLKKFLINENSKFNQSIDEESRESLKFMCKIIISQYDANMPRNSRHSPEELHRRIVFYDLVSETFHEEIIVDIFTIFSLWLEQRSKGFNVNIFDGYYELVAEIDHR